MRAKETGREASNKAATAARATNRNGQVKQKMLPNCNDSMALERCVNHIYDR